MSETRINLEETDARNSAIETFKYKMSEINLI